MLPALYIGNIIVAIRLSEHVEGFLYVIVTGIALALIVLGCVEVAIRMPSQQE